MLGLMTAQDAAVEASPVASSTEATFSLCAIVLTSTSLPLKEKDDVRAKICSSFIQQILDCRLFVPIVSANTETRGAPLMLRA
jgi:hypothetical protein